MTHGCALNLPDVKNVPVAVTDAATATVRHTAARAVVPDLGPALILVDHRLQAQDEIDTIVIGQRRAIVILPMSGRLFAHVLPAQVLGVTNIRRVR